MDRRELLRLGLAAVPATMWAQHHPEVPGMLPMLDVSSADWKPVFFNAHENETAIVLSELIIPQTDTPGAKAALVNRWMDKLLAASAPARQASVTVALGWFDTYAKKTQSAEFVKLAPAKQIAILETVSKNGADGHQQFQTIKSFTSSIYYATEIGVNELNKGGRVPTGPGCPA